MPRDYRKRFEVFSSDFLRELSTKQDDKDFFRIGGEQRACIFIQLRVRSFSTISEEMTPQELVTFLRDYTATIFPDVYESGGFVNALAGTDCEVILFDNAKGQAQAAYELVFRLRRKCLALFEDKYSAVPGSSLQFSISSGAAVFFNIGTKERMFSNVIGTDINFSSRLIGINDRYGTSVLATKLSMSRTKGFVARQLDTVRMVGLVDGFELVEPFEQDITTENNGLIELFNEGMRLMDARDWHKAQKKFEEVLSIFPNDGPSAAMAKRCETFRDESPPTDWDGLYRLES